MMNKYPTYKEARQQVKEIGIQTVKEYRGTYKAYGLPSSPSRMYMGKGWVNWDVFLGKREGNYPNYENARRIVLENGIRSMKQYQKSYKSFGLPSHPEMFYKDKGWINYKSFFSKEFIPFLPYLEAQRLVLEKGIKGEVEYKSSYYGLGLPSHPDMFYKDKGWVSWNVFLGKKSKMSSKTKENLILEKLSSATTLLKDDAPLKIIYLLASKLDKRIAKEIEELLNESSYEDRVKWVKDQLNGIKEGATVESCVPLKPSAPSILSTMEAIIEVLHDSIDNMSKEDTEIISIWMENYYHNVVNRELIKEIDGE